jgi:hypothetical protein
VRSVIALMMVFIAKGSSVDGEPRDRGVAAAIAAPLLIA